MYLGNHDLHVSMNAHESLAQLISKQKRKRQKEGENIAQICDSPKEFHVNKFTQTFLGVFSPE